MSALASDELEHVYESLARGIDAAGSKNEALFLAKLALVLGHKLGDPHEFSASVELALMDLAPPPGE